MNIDEANKIKDKILQNEEYGGIARHVENILNHKKFIQQDKESADNVRYLYDILKDIGYLRMRNYGLNENLMNEIKELFCLKLPHNENNAPTLFFFEDLSDEIDLYQNLMQNIESAPNAGEEPEKEEMWESRWRDLKDCGLKLVFSGFDITAVMLGSKLLLADTRFSEKWKQSWKIFSDNANNYLKKLYKLKGQMPSIAEKIHQELAEYNMPDDEFFRFASESAGIRKSWPKDNHFRYILRPEEVNELYQKAKHIFQEYPPAARIYFFKNALAEETLKHFIQNGCIALLTNDETLQTNSKWSLQGTLDSEPVEESISVVPMLYAGKKEKYSVHMLGPRVSGWGVRSDRLKSSFNDEKYKGAFFCSWKEYPTEEILVRFDRFIPKARFIELLNGAKDFIRLPINKVLKEKDLREEALQEAAMAVLGLQSQSEINPIEIHERIKQKSQALKRILIDATNKFKQISDDLFSGTQCADDYDIALAAKGDVKKSIKFKEMEKVAIKRTDQWKGLFSSFTKRTKKDFQELINPENGKFCYAAIIEYKNHKIELINVADLPKSQERKDIEKELSKEKDCLSIHLGITNKSNEEVFSKIIAEYKDALEKNKDLKSENLKIIRWIKFNFKFNQIK